MPNPRFTHSQGLSRRAVLRGLAALSLLGLPGCASVQGFGELGDPGLGIRASARGRQYGAAVQSGQIEGDPDFASALQREAGMLVPETELKWDVLRPAPQRFDFSGYRKIAAFAKANDMTMRGHTLLWHQANPAWLAPALSSGRKAEIILETHIRRVLTETAPMIRNWDVVNEAVHVHSPREDGLRETLWLKALGPDYIGLAFHLAHKTDPHLTLVYNDYGLEQDGDDGRRKRQCILRLLEDSVRNKVPMHALGLQSHLQAHRPLAGAEFTAFLKEVRALGLAVYVTELDLDVSHLLGRNDDRIALAQSYVRAYLDMVRRDGPVEMLLTWGLSDRYTWLHTMHRDVAGSLPLDKHLDRGPLWETLTQSWLAD